MPTPASHPRRSWPLWAAVVLFAAAAISTVLAFRRPKPPAQDLPGLAEHVRQARAVEFKSLPSGSEPAKPGAARVPQ